MKDKPQRTCEDCGAIYTPGGPRQQRCKSCAVRHDRRKNRENVAAFRARHRTPEQAERSERRKYLLAFDRQRIEALMGLEGLTASAAATKIGRGHHFALHHTRKPEVAARIAHMRFWDKPEKELPR